MAAHCGRGMIASKACDGCRRSKTRCLPSETRGKCVRCAQRSGNCTWKGQSRKRGPTRGVARSPQTGVDATEILRAEEQAPEEHEARQFNGTVDNNQETQDAARKGKASSISRTFPTHWLFRHAQPPSSFSALQPPPPTVQTSPSSDPLLPSIPASPGRVTVDEHGAVRFHSSLTGLPLVASVSWKWPFPSEHQPSPFPRAPPAALTEITLPSDHDLKNLLSAYWSFVHPQCPVLYCHIFSDHLQNFLAHKNAASLDRWHSFVSASSGQTFLLLLLSMLSLASMYPSRANLSSQYTSASSSLFFDHAMCIVKHDISHHTTENRDKSLKAYAIHLLAQREIGFGNVSSSWNLQGNAIRLAQDVNLFRNIPSWKVPSGAGFTHEELQVRLRTWYSLINFTNMLDSLRGFPPTINESCYDAPFPSVDEPDEHSQWRHPDVTPSFFSMPNNSSFDYRTQQSSMASLKSHALSTFTASTSLSIITGRVLKHISDVAVQPRSDTFAIKHNMIVKQLDQWLAQLPSALSLDSAQYYRLPHVIELHCHFHSSTILCWRPYLTAAFSDQATHSFNTDTQTSVNSPSSRRSSFYVPFNNTSSPTSSNTTSSPGLLEQRKALARSACTNAARQINVSISTFAKAFGIRFASWKLIYYIFNAAIIHIYDKAHEDVEEKKHDAERRCFECIDALASIQKTWPGAVAPMDILLSILNAEGDYPSSGSKAFQQRETSRHTVQPDLQAQFDLLDFLSFDSGIYENVLSQMS